MQTGPGLFVTLNTVKSDLGQEMTVDDWMSALNMAEKDERFSNVEDVGIVFITDESERVIVSWQLVFLLAPINAFVGHDFHVSKLLGRITKGSEFLMAMSSLDFQERGALVISIEAVC